MYRIEEKIVDAQIWQFTLTFISANFKFGTIVAVTSSRPASMVNIGNHSNGQFIHKLPNCK